MLYQPASEKDLGLPLRTVMEMVVQLGDFMETAEIAGDKTSTASEERWIPVTEKLPETPEHFTYEYEWMQSEQYLVANDKRERYLAEYIIPCGKSANDAPHWTESTEGSEITRVTHWRPVPAAPEVEAS